MDTDDAKVSTDRPNCDKSLLNACRGKCEPAVFQLLADMAGRIAALEAGTGPAPRDLDSRAVGDAVRLWFLFRGEHDFNAGELFRYSRTDAGVALRDALDAAGIQTAIQLGKRLAAIAGADLDGLTVERIGGNAAGAIWQIRSAVCAP